VGSSVDRPASAADGVAVSSAGDVDDRPMKRPRNRFLVDLVAAADARGYLVDEVRLGLVDRVVLLVDVGQDGKRITLEGEVDMLEMIAALPRGDDE
jgi:hypothetical protein